MSESGGRAAARGFQYQYFRTLEALVNVVDDDQVSAVRVEGDTDASRVDVVDFDVVDHDERCLRAVQVKSRSAGGVMSAAEAFGVLRDLVNGADASEYQLLTNAEPGPGLTQLCEALDSDSGVEEMQAELLAVLHSAPKRTHQLVTMAPEILDRLRRARVCIDSRDDRELSEQIRERLRELRNDAREGLGLESAGLLTGYLVSEVLWRACHDKRAQFTRQEFRQHLLVSGDVLARSLGRRDWGVVVGMMPAVPDVARTEPLSELTSALSTNESGVQRAVVSGPSGIGKSSLAAAFVADRADSYDLVCWVNAESDSAVAASFRDILLHVGHGADVAGDFDDTQVRSRVHAHLSATVGRWLMIFDNASDARKLAPWLPAAGSGDIIVTTLDSVGRFVHGPTVSVPPMTADEAAGLLRRRLNLESAAVDGGYDSALASLSDAMGYWPLALELAAGYMSSCGITIDRVDDFIERLKRRALDDELSIPPGYPRTLSAAVIMCVESLEESSRQEADSAQRLCPLVLLAAAAYTASRRIPVHMLAAAFFDTDDETSKTNPAIHGPTYIDPQWIDLGEVVRDLRRFSLVDVDEDLPESMDSAVADGGFTIAVNSIIQDLVRDRWGDRDNTLAIIDALAIHTNLWMMSALQLSRVQRALSVFTHAMVVVDSSMALGKSTDNILILLGNVALMHHNQGHHEIAETLWLTELDILKHEDSGADLFVKAQVKIELVKSFIDRPDRSRITAAQARAWTGEILTFMQRLAVEVPEGAQEHITPLLMAFRNPRGQHLRRHDHEFETLYQLLTELVQRLPPVPISEAAAELARIEELILNQDCDYNDLKQRCQQLIANGQDIGATELDVRRLLIEVLLRQEDWSAARDEYDVIKQRIGSTPMLPDTVEMLLHNVGLHCAVAYLLDIDNSTVAPKLLTDLLEWPQAIRAANEAETTSRQRCYLLRAVGDLINGDLQKAEELLNACQLDELHGDVPGLGKGKGWQLVWEYARLHVLQRSWSAMNEGAPQ